MLEAEALEVDQVAQGLQPGIGDVNGVQGQFAEVRHPLEVSEAGIAELVAQGQLPQARQSPQVDQLFIVVVGDLDAQFSEAAHPLQADQAGRGELVAGELERPQPGQAGEGRQSGSLDAVAAEAQDLELGQALQVRQAGVGDLVAGEGELPELGEGSQQLEGGIVDAGASQSDPDHRPIRSCLVPLDPATVVTDLSDRLIPCRIGPRGPDDGCSEPGHQEREQQIPGPEGSAPGGGTWRGHRPPSRHAAGRPTCESSCLMIIRLGIADETVHLSGALAREPRCPDP